MQAHEFFLVNVTFDDIPNRESVEFVCNSWIYNFKNYKKDASSLPSAELYTSINYVNFKIFIFYFTKYSIFFNTIMCIVKKIHFCVKYIM